MGSSLFWDVTNGAFVVGYPRLWTSYLLHLQVSNSPRRLLVMKMGPIVCHETSVSCYQSTLRNIPEQRRSHILCYRIWKVYRLKKGPWHIYIYIYIHTHVTLPLYIYIYIYTHTQVKWYMCIYIHISLYLYIYIYVYIHTGKVIYVCMCVCVCVCVCVYIYIYIYILSWTFFQTIYF